jgi:hypothetical protein
MTVTSAGLDFEAHFRPYCNPDPRQAVGPSEPLLCPRDCAQGTRSPGLGSARVVPLAIGQQLQARGPATHNRSGSAVPGRLAAAPLCPRIRAPIQVDARPRTPADGRLSGSLGPGHLLAARERFHSWQCGTLRAGCCRSPSGLLGAVDNHRQSSQVRFICGPRCMGAVWRRCGLPFGVGLGLWMSGWDACCQELNHVCPIAVTAQTRARGCGLLVRLGCVG